MMNTIAYANVHPTTLAPWVSGWRSCWVFWPPGNWVYNEHSGRHSAALVSAPALARSTALLSLFCLFWTICLLNNLSVRLLWVLERFFSPTEDSWWPSEVPVWWCWWSLSPTPVFSHSLWCEGTQDGKWACGSLGSLSQWLHQQQLCRQVNTADLEMATSMRRPEFWTSSLCFGAGHYLSSLGEKGLWRTDGWVFSKALRVYVETWERCKPHLCCLSFSFFLSASRPLILETHLKGLLFIIFSFFSPLNSSGINLGYLGGRPDNIPVGLHSFAVMRSCLVWWCYSQ